MTTTTKHAIGVISVDAGLVMVGDPCYCLHKSKNAVKAYDRPPKDFGNNWHEFCVKLQGKDSLQFNHDLGHTGLAVVMGGFGGDGVYPVSVEKDQTGRIVKLVVDF